MFCIVHIVFFHNLKQIIISPNYYNSCKCLFYLKFYTEKMRRKGLKYLNNHVFHKKIRPRVALLGQLPMRTHTRNPDSNQKFGTSSSWFMSTVFLRQSADWLLGASQSISLHVTPDWLSQDSSYVSHCLAVMQKKLKHLKNQHVLLNRVVTNTLMQSV